MLNKEYIEAILKLLNAENDTFDGNFYSFSYFPKNTKTEDIDYNAPRPVCLKDIHLDNVRIFGQGVQKFVQLNLYTAL